MSEPLTAAGAAKCPHRWQPSKTDAEGTCYEYACWRCGGTKRTLYGDALARAEAAARAVDEALSVERVKAAILSVGMENPHWSWRCEYPAKGESKCDLGDEAADLVAHLRGPR